VSNNGSGAQVETTQLTKMMMELSKAVLEIKNEIKEKAVDHRPRYNGSNSNNRWNRNGNNSNDNNNNTNSNGNRMGGNRSPIVCYACGEPGHISRTCPQRNNNIGNVAATIPTQQPQQLQTTQPTHTQPQPPNMNSMNTNNNELIALVQQLLAQNGANGTTSRSLN